MTSAEPTTTPASATEPTGRPRPRRRMILGVIGGLLAALAIGAGVTSMPPVCASCHRPHADALAQGAHAQTACYTCHLDAGVWSWPGHKAAEWFRMYPAHIGGGAGLARATAAAACLECHEDVYARSSAARGLRVRHDTCASDVRTCDGCHGAISHLGVVRWVRQIEMERCIECHRRNAATRECDACHDGRRTAERLAAGPWQVTHGPQWETAHALGSLRYCDTCHPADYCVRCHGVVLPHPEDFGRTHGKEALRVGERCAECHEDPRVCEGCHGIAMPHPERFLVTHGTQADGMVDLRCPVCHRATDCADCHARHIHPATTEGTIGDADGRIDLSGVTR